MHDDSKQVKLIHAGRQERHDWHQGPQGTFFDAGNVCTYFAMGATHPGVDIGQYLLSCTLKIHVLYYNISYCGSAISQGKGIALTLAVPHSAAFLFHLAAFP